MNIYTKKGDKGETTTAGGKRVLKCDFNIEAVGEIDELNAALGMIKLPETEKIQEDLFGIGAIISGRKVFSIKYLEFRVKEMEKEIDRMWKEMPQLKNFIFFGGSEEASLIFFARAVARRAERGVVALRRDDLTEVVKYLNRLSDYLFCLGRWVNFKKGIKERVWKGD
jgi:cob(I)alamin adenosyltransferase